MISIGIDISKDKSTICALKDGSEIIWKLFDLSYLEKDMNDFLSKLKTLSGEVRIIMEATVKYHLPVLYHLNSAGHFVSVINLLKMKQFCRSLSFRKAKNDQIDSKLIAEYGLMYWHRLEGYTLDAEVYQTLRHLNCSYQNYMDLKISQMNFLDRLISQVFLGLEKLLPHGAGDFKKDKLLDFLETWWNKNLVLAETETEFIKDFQKWAKAKRYHPSAKKAQAIYKVAQEGVSTQPSNSPYIRADVYEDIQLVKRINQSFNFILSQMVDLAESLEEFQEAKNFSVISDKLAVQITAEFGDLSKFKNKKCLISYIGIDASPYESGGFKGNQRKISKRGNTILRKVGYQAIKCIMSAKRPDNPIYCYMVKKEKEGKVKKVCKFAGLNKFLRIYYARVMEVKIEKEVKKGSMNNFY